MEVIDVHPFFIYVPTPPPFPPAPPIPSVPPFPSPRYPGEIFGLQCRSEILKPVYLPICRVRHSHKRGPSLSPHTRFYTLSMNRISHRLGPWMVNDQVDSEEVFEKSTSDVTIIASGKLKPSLTRM